MSMKKPHEEKISSAMKKYLIGKELKDRLREAEEVYIAALERGDAEYIEKHKLNSKGKIAAILGEECHLSASTVIGYGNYADALEQIKEKNEKLVQQILSGNTRMTYTDLKHLIKVLD